MEGHAPENAMSLFPVQMMIIAIKHNSPVLMATTVNKIFFIKMHQSTSRDNGCRCSGDWVIVTTTVVMQQAIGGDSMGYI